ncbi:hypothetical protein VTN96DRAFT_10289 [Rasamsonia emersonii]
MGEYILQQNPDASVRLDAQHFLARMQFGYLLYPSIPVTEGMKIADIGSGTGIWLLEVATTVPKSVQLDGFDIFDDQYPAKEYLPDNIHLGVLDALADHVLDHLQGICKKGH